MEVRPAPDPRRAPPHCASAPPPCPSPAGPPPSPGPRTDPDHPQVRAAAVLAVSVPGRKPQDVPTFQAPCQALLAAQGHGDLTVGHHRHLMGGGMVVVKGGDAVAFRPPSATGSPRGAVQHGGLGTAPPADSVSCSGTRVDRLQGSGHKEPPGGGRRSATGAVRRGGGQGRAWAICRCMATTGSILAAYARTWASRPKVR